MRQHGMEVVRGRVRFGVAVLVCGAIVGACVPSEPSGPDPRPKEWAAQLQAKLDDPAFVASLGTSDEERQQAVDAIRQFIADPPAGFDAATFDAESASNQARAAAEKQAADDARTAQVLADGEVRQREVGSELMGAPSYDDVKNQPRDETADDATETGEAMLAKDGSGETAAAYNDRMPKVLEALASGEASEDPLVNTLRELGYDDSGSITSNGPCDGRTGTRLAPRGHNTRPGTLYTPRQDTFVGTTGPNRAVYSGDLQTRMHNGQEQYLVEGHVMDSAISDTVIGNMVALSNIDQFQLHVFMQVPGATAPLEYWGGNGTVTPTFEVHFLCYAEDANLAPGDQITRGYFQAWMPAVNINDAFTLHEPGFQVRTAIADHYWGGPYTPFSFFWGADQRTVHVGPQPLAHHDPVPAGVGATLNTGFLVDDNSQADDDLESMARGLITTAINNKIPSVDGQDGWALALGNLGWYHYQLNNVNPGTTNVDLSLQPSASPSGNGNDDEYRFRADVQLDNVDIDGYVMIAYGGLVPCAFTTKADVHATVDGSIDIGQTPAQLTTDLTISLSNLSLHNQIWQPLPLACNLGYLTTASTVEAKIQTVVANALVDLPETIGNLLSSRADIADYVNHTVNIGTHGNGFVTALGGFDHTCAPYGCDGVHAGDVGMVDTGLEVSGDFLVTDRKPGNQGRRFPFSYQPSTQHPVSSLIRDHETPDGQTYSAAAFVSAATLNQLLRSVTEGGVLSRGILDTRMSEGAPLNMRADVAPIFVDQALSGHTLSLFLPDLRIDNGGYERLAANLSVGLDVTYDEATNSLQPSTIGVNDVAAGLGLVALRCSSLLWSICLGVPQLISNVANELGGTILPALTQNTIAQVTLPSVAGMPILWGRLENVGGNLAAYLKVGAQHVNVTWTSTANSQFHFSATPLNFNGSGPVTYHWVTTDDVDQAPLEDVTNQSTTHAFPIGNVPQHGQLSGSPTYNFVTHEWQQSCFRTRRARMTVTATQGPNTATGSTTAFLFQAALVSTPVQSQLQALCS